jgi:rhodanese-related sulfurtransferase
MKKLLTALVLSFFTFFAIAIGNHTLPSTAQQATPQVQQSNQPTTIPNSKIDASGFQQIVRETAAERETHRLTETQFIQAMQEKGVVLLDARSSRNFDKRHVKGAVNLPFTEFTAASLAQIIPQKNSKILIYCNNNFDGSPAAFAMKAPVTALNLSTYTNLRGYGYTNIYELGPFLDVKTTKIPFAGTEIAAASTVNKKP